MTLKRKKKTKPLTIIGSRVVKVGEGYLLLRKIVKHEELGQGFHFILWHFKTKKEVSVFVKEDDLESGAIPEVIFNEMLNTINKKIKKK